MAKKDKEKSSGIKKAVKAAGSNIAKGELKTITKAAGGNVAKALNRISGADAALNSGAANMLIKQSQDAPGYMRPELGTSKIAEALRSMIGTPAYTAQRNPQAGAPYGGSRVAVPGTGMMIGGTQIRPGGKVAVKKQEQRMDAAAPAAPAETTAAAPAQDAFDFQGYLDQLVASMQQQQMADMSALSDMYSAQFQDLYSVINNMQAQGPMQIMPLGQVYAGEGIRAPGRTAKQMMDYRRGMASAGPSQSLAIGGGIVL